LTEQAKTLTSNPGTEKARVIVCAGTPCVSAGALDIYEEFEERLSAVDLPAEVVLEDEKVENEGLSLDLTGCPGFCEQGPLVRIDPVGILYTNVTVEDVETIIDKTLAQGEVIEDLCYEDVSGQRVLRENEISFYSSQKRLVLDNCGYIRPDSLGDYRRAGGLKALQKVLAEMTPEQVCDQILASNLRGRGGAGYPTGQKWKFTLSQQAEEKFIVANCDEGDPGAFMDRSLIEGDPYRVLEGMIIGAYAVGASQGFVYIRIEYPLAIKRLEKAVENLREQGFLGKNILDSGLDLDIDIRRGAGAFVCGEETALLHSIEGKRGMPRPRPPYPSQSGLWDRPTVINNVETLANVPDIINRGADWYSDIGTENSPGTKVFALAGDVVNTGLVEVPMGISLEEVVNEIGGGVPGGKKLKAVQTGGPAGGCIPADELDVKVDFESLAEKGSIMGSGGMIVMDEETCMVDLAKYFIEFSREESCGKCTPCREGNTRLLEILERITRGAGKEEDIDLLRRLSELEQKASLCGLGQAAPNPVVSTLDYFEEEYRRHIEEQECPAGACRYLVTYLIEADPCVGCGACARVCPVDCISGESQEPHEIDQNECIKCGQCYEVCNFEAVLRK